MASNRSATFTHPRGACRLLTTALVPSYSSKFSLIMSPRSHTEDIFDAKKDVAETGFSMGRIIVQWGGKEQQISAEEYGTFFLFHQTSETRIKFEPPLDFCARLPVPHTVPRNGVTPR